MQLTCWQCGTNIDGVIMPLSRREECPQCRAELHVCRQCQHFEPDTSDQCREDRAEQVSDKTRANFCDYFALKPDVTVASDGATQVSDELAALFGLEAKPEAEPPADPWSDLSKDE